ncbi:hypothetical protein KAM398_02390 [Acinetobacter sp. KAM398]|uniref:hypothetical protein n=1 Tax=unclassified Acinetobacter TaxID=196816 RepID=UPI001F382C7F|nr:MULTISPECIES: hypothetical protein [unclassified Acinetobacter]GJC30260.1 hypothetical protein KAM392_02390 [Acinetobacter sp. KAM392]GJC33070.1 hypothetical protein KAM393_02390 [Acinetobacter sp. KAM393]GJC35899.1 hypothetical protein KAM394_02390 [Acinetobacter sp. KAM394]GJC38526.1 hypothetical protein KAM395_00470 [Acinetobacter sp. KAM395]GJC41351.1 hypothetical protein KAM396_00480 [Acinetobacter sp. KAM396]
MAIDPNIILQGAAMQQEIQQRNNAGLQNLIGAIGQIGYDSKVRKMRQLQDPKEQQAFANNSIFANRLNTQLKADQLASAKAAADQLKFNADLGKTYAEIGKIGSESGKIGAETGKITTETGITRQNNVGSIWSAFLTGGPNAAKAQLESMKNNGVISPENYQAELDALTNMPTNAAEAQQYALGRFKGLQDPKYSLTTADNVLDNQTSANNNIRTTQASIYSTDKDYQLGQQELQVKQALEQQKINIEQNQGEVVAGADGMGYIFYKNRPAGSRYEPLLGQDGKHAKAPAANSGKGGMSATAQKELFEVTDSISAAQNGIENLRAALNYSKTAYDGFGATQRAAVAGNLTDSEAATATAMLNNIVTGNALEMLKATFGGAPTEGERAILLQLQGSANLPRAQREAIYNRAIQMAERRLQSNQAKAEGIRNGSYFQSQQGGGGSGGASLSYFK